MMEQYSRDVIAGRTKAGKLIKESHWFVRADAEDMERLKTFYEKQGLRKVYVNERFGERNCRGYVWR